jgi:methyl-accepting chemotaxis protein
MTGTEYKIRFPASCNSDGSLNFVCTMLEGSVIKIMDSEEKDQITSAKQAAKIALNASKGQRLAGAIIFDCACRAAILQEQFSEVIEVNKEVLGSLPFVGGETYGEIAMELGQLSGFHNTTSVIMLFPD